MQQGGGKEYGEAVRGACLRLLEEEPGKRPSAREFRNLLLDVVETKRVAKEKARAEAEAARNKALLKRMGGGGGDGVGGRSGVWQLGGMLWVQMLSAVLLAVAMMYLWLAV